jgi:hypothetical protein
MGTKDTADTDAELGGFTVTEFGLLFKMCRSSVYSEAKDGKLKISKVRNKSIITRGEARRYQRALEAAS